MEPIPLVAVVRKAREHGQDLSLVLGPSQRLDKIFGEVEITVCTHHACERQDGRARTVVCSAVLVRAYLTLDWWLCNSRRWARIAVVVTSSSTVWSVSMVVSWFRAACQWWRAPKVA